MVHGEPASLPSVLVARARLNAPFTRLAGLLLGALLLVPAAADADVVPVLGPHGRIDRREAPGVAARERLPAAAGATHLGERRRPGSARAARRRTVLGELRRLRAAGALDAATRDAHRAEYLRDRRLARRLTGRRRVELAGVLATLDGLAARGSLTASRVPVLFLTLQRNREWWARGPLLASGQRVSFDGSQLVWQYVPGAGLQFHPLANFGKLNALFKARTGLVKMTRLLDELLPLAADRAGGIAWEYDYAFDGGLPPWVSSLAQGTGLQAMARAAVRAGRGDELLPRLRRGLRVFEVAPPAGVRTRADGGLHFVQYSFAPRLRILNGFIQSLVGLYDFAQIAQDRTAGRLFARGDAAARKEVPTFDTGAWSLYSRGTATYESDLNYHEVLIGFLQSLCDRTTTAVYCDAASRFRRDLRTPPRLSVPAQRLRAGRPGRLRFRVSKLSRVTVQLRRGGRLVLSRTSMLGRGRQSVRVTPPRRTRAYEVTLTATDLAGNAAGPVRAAVAVAAPARR